MPREVEQAQTPTAQPTQSPPASRAEPTATLPFALRGQFQKYLDLGLYLVKDGNNDPAIKAFNEAEKIQPNFFSFYGRGWAYANKGDYFKAIAEYDKAIGLDPGKSVAYMMRGWSYYALDEFDFAIDDHTKALSIDPKLYQGYLGRGAARAEKGEDALALDDYGHAIKLQPHESLAYYYRGILYTQEQSYDEATADFDKVIELDPKSRNALLSRGFVYYSEGDYQQAIDEYNKAMQLWHGKSDATAFYFRGLSYAGQEENAKAIQDYTEAIRLDPKYAAPYLERANLYADMPDKKQEAIADYRRVLQMSSDARTRETVTGKLRALEGQ